jgi:hypothetical protein
MLRFLRIPIVVLFLSAVWASTSAAATAPGCINPGDSALNQYCETIPAPAGGQTPRLGLPALAATLPTPVAKQLASAKGARRALATLPAPQHPRRAPSSRPAVAVSTATTSTLPLWLILALVAVALTSIGAAAARWRRRRSGDPPGGTLA